MENVKLLMLLQISIPIVILTVTYIIGTILERRHFASIRAREAELRELPAVTLGNGPSAWRIEQSRLVTGSVVISLDYFKRFLARLRALVGGRIKTYEPLLDRARREALLRMKAAAIDSGFDAVINVRVETSRLANARGNQGVAGVEVLAFGTAIKRAA